MKQLVSAHLIYILLKRYIQEKKFFISINARFLIFGFINEFIIQRSVLGPILCIILFADMPTIANNATVIYADDIAILSSDETNGIQVWQLPIV